jgi:PAS domain S-box-containing protein
VNLTKYEQKYLELSQDCFIVATIDGHFLEVSPFFTKLLGWTTEELQSRHLNEFIHPNDRLATSAACQKQVQEGNVIEMINRYQKKDGDYVYLSWVSHLDPESGLIMACARDVTGEQRALLELQEERRVTYQNTKLVSLGKMAASIAHEITNPLSLVLGHASLAKEKLSQGEDIASYLDQVERGAERALSIVKALRTLTYDERSAEPECVDLVELIDETLSYCHERIQDKNIQLACEFEFRPLVMIRALELSQVILNVLNNAVDAVCGQEHPWIKLQLENHHNEVYLTISDSGAGVDEEMKERIFDSFVTTKERGVGNGIGLTLSKEMLKRQGGDILFRSNSPTTFEIRLPVRIVLR